MPGPSASPTPRLPTCDQYTLGAAVRLLPSVLLGGLFDGSLISTFGGKLRGWPIAQSVALFFRRLLFRLFIKLICHKARATYRPLPLLQAGGVSNACEAGVVPPCTPNAPPVPNLPSPPALCNFSPRRRAGCKRQQMPRRVLCPWRVVIAEAFPHRDPKPPPKRSKAARCIRAN
jgi:hypothetical protein